MALGARPRLGVGDGSCPVGRPQTQGITGPWREATPSAAPHVASVFQDKWSVQGGGTDAGENL